MSRSLRNCLEQQDKFPKAEVHWLVIRLPKQLKFCWLWLAWAQPEQTKGKEQFCTAGQVKGFIQICPTFRSVPLLHHSSRYLQCEARFRGSRQHSGDTLQLLFPSWFVCQQQLRTLLYQESFRLIVEMKKSHNCYWKRVSTYDHS